KHARIVRITLTSLNNPNTKQEQVIIIRIQNKTSPNNPKVQTRTSINNPNT
ncbi:hypothetical protein Leryth_025932, partial [Lithospermum erythrorhizon]